MLHIGACADAALLTYFLRHILVQKEFASLFLPLGEPVFNNIMIKHLYTFIKSQVTYRTCYNQSTGYTKYGSPRRLATR